MTDPARGSNKDNRDAPADESGRVSGPQPSARYEPWPIGADAFATPLAPTASEPPRFSRRAQVLGSVFGVAFGVAVAALGLAWLLRPGHAVKPAAASVSHALRAAGAEPTHAAAAKAQPVEVAAVEPHAVPVASEPPVVEPARAAAVPADPQVPAANDSARASAAPEPQARESSHRSSSSDSAAHKHGHDRNAKLPQQLDRAQVIAAMNTVRPAVLGCFGAARGAATANVRIAGATGRITSVQVSGQAGSVGSCIARAVRGAHFPRFAADSLAISYPFAK